jgi:hypothetical protein
MRERRRFPFVERAPRDAPGRQPSGQRRIIARSIERIEVLEQRRVRGASGESSPPGSST